MTDPYFFNTNGFSAREGVCAADPLVITCQRCGESLQYAPLGAETTAIDDSLDEHRATCEVKQ